MSDDIGMVEEVRRLRDHGRVGKYEHEVIGWCSRLDGLQASILLAKLLRLPAWTERRQLLAKRYCENLAGASGSKLVPWEEGAVHHIIAVRVPNGSREVYRSRMAADGIETAIHYPVPLSRQPALSAWSTPAPAAEAASDEVLSLPMDPLMSLDEVDQVCRALSRAGGFQSSAQRNNCDAKPRSSAPSDDR